MCRLILLPGLGADHRLYEAQKVAFPQLTIPDWIEPDPRETLGSYARRLAEAIDPGEPCFVGGTSLGGMIAQEMARHLDARACFMIACIRSSAELPRRASMFRPVVRWIPSGLGSVPVVATRIALPVIGPVLRPHAKSLIAQFSDRNGRFLRWAAWGILNWRPSVEPVPCPVLHIHGDRDWILPHRLTQSDVIVPGGGHFLPMTHAAEVSDFLRSGMRKFAR